MIEDTQYEGKNMYCVATDQVTGVMIIYIKAIWVIDQVGLQVGLRALNGRGRMNSMWKSQLKP